MPIYKMDITQFIINLKKDKVAWRTITLFLIGLTHWEIRIQNSPIS